MLKQILYLDLLKTIYRELSNELTALASQKGVTESAGKKSGAYSKIMNERQSILAEYNDIKKTVLNWLESTYSNPKYSQKLRCYHKFYSDITYTNFQETIDSLYPPQFIAQKGEGVKAYYFTASNLKSALHKSCLRHLENN